MSDPTRRGSSIIAGWQWRPSNSGPTCRPRVSRPQDCKWNDDITSGGVDGCVGRGESFGRYAAIRDEHDTHDILRRRHRGWSFGAAVPATTASKTHWQCGRKLERTQSVRNANRKSYVSYRMVRPWVTFDGHFTTILCRTNILNKLAQYGTDGRLFATDVSAKIKVTWQKLGQISKIWPDQI